MTTTRTRRRGMTNDHRPPATPSAPACTRRAAVVFLVTSLRRPRRARATERAEREGGGGIRNRFVPVDAPNERWDALARVNAGAVRFPRSRLSVPFAVCLLRSAYEAIDECDVAAMDAFQAKSWLFRQSEWEGYRYLYDPVRVEQGAIYDANYFDFAAFVQTATVGRMIPTSTSVFEERTGAEGTKTVVRRDEALRDNAKLPEAIAEKCGFKIYDRLLNGFDRGEDFEVARFANVPSPAERTPGRDADDVTREVVDGMRALADVFVENGYALRISVENDGTNSDGSVRVRVRANGPATLWGARELAVRGLTPTDEYLGFTMTAYLARSGVGSSYTERVSDTEIDMSWTLSVA